MDINMPYICEIQLPYSNSNIKPLCENDEPSDKYVGMWSDLIKLLHLNDPNLWGDAVCVLHGSDFRLSQSYSSWQADEPQSAAVTEQATGPQRKVGVEMLLDILHAGLISCQIKQTFKAVLQKMKTVISLYFF